MKINRDSIGPIHLIKNKDYLIMISTLKKLTKNIIIIKGSFVKVHNPKLKDKKYKMIQTIITIKMMINFIKKF